MTHPSDTLRSVVAAKPAEELNIWVQQRLDGEDGMPLLYQGKEIERPHEAVAAVFGLNQDVLTPAKRNGVIEALKNVRRAIQEEWVEGIVIPQHTEKAKYWAEIISAVKPEELRKDARMLLEACLMAPVLAHSALPEIAAAATGYSETGEPDLVLWNKLLGKAQTAALAFRRLLEIESFTTMSRHWLELLKRRLQDKWPTNIRLLTAALLSKEPSNTAAIEQLATLVIQAGLGKQAVKELELSKNESVKDLVLNLEAILNCKVLVYDEDLQLMQGMMFIADWWCSHAYYQPAVPSEDSISTIIRPERRQTRKMTRDDKVYNNLSGHTHHYENSGIMLHSREAYRATALNDIKLPINPPSRRRPGAQFDVLNQRSKMVNF
ncbi:hypothetical protein [Prosthecobacter fluviatilis]|uniref:Uncharacterized protein n=1 Tax=Prosthecobacter fluviatilis TaxID=445931 RepID=A0ABW0KWZ8_9BACT